MVFTLKLVYVNRQVPQDTSYTDSLITLSTTDILSMTFAKERYTPYTQLSGKALVEKYIYDVKSIELSCDDTVLHFGPPDALEWEEKDGCCILSFTSRGYTSALGQNQLVPGLHYNTTFKDLMTSEIVLPYVTYDESHTQLNYIYIKENDTMWDAATAFDRKFSKNYPYIQGANKVRLTRDSYGHILYLNSEDIISASVGQDYSHRISHYHMKDLEGTYNTFSLTNPDVVEREIIRHKHIAFDRQWLSDQNEAMQSRFDFSERGHRYIKVSYHGYHGEDLRNDISFATKKIQVNNREISRLELSLSPKGVITTLWFYSDSYSN